MIAQLRGILREKHPPYLLIDVHGIGYELEAPITTFSILPELGEKLTLYTHQIIREDAHRLYGFAGRSERDTFRLLLRVSGVGAKMALAILSGMDAVAFSRCVHEGDAKSLERLPGIGKKTAQRLIIEMQHRFDPIPERAPVVGGIMIPGPKLDAISALIALGLKRPEASRRIEAMDCDGLACEEIVRRALQSMVK
uniref:Holliday junction branch migration complex subunit RuvA n=1 Tax=Candidatus Kentrum sp. TUN TaxID=2126343 RepID=A0A450ZFS4_9GAMM|nr:MAG: Holliday junction DNA helicase subunit RuvA [Candidatus Kentron sp. TUN]VFK53146.1 MAG: Holliday junction DNA helicase subunit RuvA [Candidatus Kentron sp. TUN]VFK55709.1 MAG: Holliday junction DNA helicase subunit RuvA [Candidatus Kentron sp. TUN]